MDVLEKVNWYALQTEAKGGKPGTSADITPAQLKSQVENRLSQVRDVIIDIRNRHDTEVRERRSLEQQMQIRFSHVQEHVSDQIRQREEAMQAVRNVTREKEQAAENERQRMEGRLGEMVEKLATNIISKEKKISGETMEKVTQLEKLVNEDKAKRVEEDRNTKKFVKETVEEAQKKQEEVRKKQEEESKQLMDQLTKLVNSEKAKRTEEENSAKNHVKELVDEARQKQEETLKQNLEQLQKMMNTENEKRAEEDNNTKSYVKETVEDVRKKQEEDKKNLDQLIKLIHSEKAKRSEDEQKTKNFVKEVVEEAQRKQEEVQKKQKEENKQNMEQWKKMMNSEKAKRAEEEQKTKNYVKELVEEVRKKQEEDRQNLENMFKLMRAENEARIEDQKNLKNKLFQMMEDILSQHSNDCNKLKESVRILNAENAERSEELKNIKNTMFQMMEDIRRQHNDDCNKLNETIKNDRPRLQEMVKKVEGALTNLAGKIDGGQKQMDKLLTAESKSRKQHERDSRDRMETLHEKVQASNEAFQETVNRMTERTNVLMTLPVEIQQVRDLTELIGETQRTEASELRQMFEEFKVEVNGKDIDLEAQIEAGDMSEIEKSMATVRVNGLRNRKRLIAVEKKLEELASTEGAADFRFYSLSHLANIRADIDGNKKRRKRRRKRLQTPELKVDAPHHVSDGHTSVRKRGLRAFFSRRRSSAISVGPGKRSPRAGNTPRRSGTADQLQASPEEEEEATSQQADSGTMVVKTDSEVEEMNAELMIERLNFINAKDLDKILEEFRKQLCGVMNSKLNKANWNMTQYIDSVIHCGAEIIDYTTNEIRAQVEQWKSAKPASEDEYETLPRPNKDLNPPAQGVSRNPSIVRSRNPSPARSRVVSPARSGNPSPARSRSVSPARVSEAGEDRSQIRHHTRDIMPAPAWRCVVTKPDEVEPNNDQAREDLLVMPGAERIGKEKGEEEVPEKGQIKRVKSSSRSMTESLSARVDLLARRCEMTEAEMRDIRKLMDAVPVDVFEFGERLADVRDDMDIRLRMEINNRNADVQAVRTDLALLKDCQLNIDKREFDKCVITTRRLGETIQTVKTVLGMKIQHEEKTKNVRKKRRKRTDEVCDLREDVTNLRTLLEPLIAAREKNLLLKPDDMLTNKYEQDPVTPDINKWGGITAISPLQIFGPSKPFNLPLAWSSDVRWLHWKQRLDSLRPEDGVAKPEITDSDKENEKDKERQV